MSLSADHSRQALFPIGIAVRGLCWHVAAHQAPHSNRALFPAGPLPATTHLVGCRLAVRSAETRSGLARPQLLPIAVAISSPPRSASGLALSALAAASNQSSRRSSA